MGSVDQNFVAVTVLGSKKIGLDRSSMGEAPNSQQQKQKIVTGDGGYVLEDVPHLSDYIPNLPVILSLSLKSFSIYVAYI